LNTEPQPWGSRFKSRPWPEICFKISLRP